MWRKLCGSVLAAAVIVTSGSDARSGTRVQALTQAPNVWNAPWVVQIKLTSLTGASFDACADIAPPPPCDDTAFIAPACTVDFSA